MQKQLLPTMIATGLLASLVLTGTLQSSETVGEFGPVDSITLSGTDGDLTLSNTNERLSWGEEKTSRLWSVGFMETGKALEQLMQAEHFVEARDELNAELEEEIAAAREVLDDVGERGRLLEPDHPKVPEIRREWDEAYRRFERIQQKSVQIRGGLAAQQMQESYNEVVEAVNVVSDRLSIDIVLRFIPPDGDFERNTPEATIMQIRLRTALRLPDGVDITHEVLSELGLEMQ